MSKIMDNVYRDANIALANEFSLVCHEIGIDVMESIEVCQYKSTDADSDTRMRCRRQSV